MIRLYVDIDFKKDAQIDLPKDELRYFKSVRRGQGPVSLFNQKGQVAEGKIEGNSFVIEAVKTSEHPFYNLCVAVALPDAGVIPPIIRSLSELGVAELLFFEGERSQKAKARLNVSPRWERISIESARQCGRGKPLEIKVGDWASIEGLDDIPLKLFLDEAPLDNVKETSPLSEKALILVGPAGGWTV
jgi:RsmE family RNA methyltransferase